MEAFYPPEAAWGSVKAEQGFVPPLGTIAVYRWLTEKGYDVDFFDTQFGDHDEEKLKSLLRESQYNLIGLPVFTPTANYVFETAKLIRSALPDCIIIYGGVHVTDCSAESLEESPECDFIILTAYIKHKKIRGLLIVSRTTLATTRTTHYNPH